VIPSIEIHLLANVQGVGVRIGETRRLTSNSEILKADIKGSIRMGRKCHSVLANNISWSSVLVSNSVDNLDKSRLILNPEKKLGQFP
jgi:hypothetical protein